MVLNSRRLIGLPVRTRSGERIGRVLGFDVDVDTGKLAAIRVRAPGLIPHFVDQEVSVGWAQVVSIDEKEVVVSDGTVPAGGRLLVKGVHTPT